MGLDSSVLPVLIPLFLVLGVILSYHTSEAAVRLLYEPMDHSAVEGKRAHFTCIFRDIPDDMKEKYNVSWTKDSYIINEPNGFDRFSFHNNYGDRTHTLRIDPVKRMDGGGYRCHLLYNGELLLTSIPGILTIREIPSDKYPLVELGKPTYKIGEKVTVKSLCEKTNPLAELEWGLSEQRLRLGPATKFGENNTHIWIEATVPATPDLDGVCFECKLKVKYEIAPRYSQSDRLTIIGGELVQTTSKKPTQKTHMTNFLTTKLSDSKAENDKTFAKAGTRPVAYNLRIAVALSVCVSVIFNAITS